MPTKCLICLSTVVLGLALPSLGQNQRLAVPPGTFTLGPGGTAAREAFCLDKHLYAARGLAPYEHIITPQSRAMVSFSGGRKMGLAEAIAQGLIAINGGSGSGKYSDYDTGIGLEFSNRTSEQVTIAMLDPLAVGQHSGTFEVPLDPLRHEITQPEVWRLNRTVRLLRVLDYLDDQGFTDEKLKVAVLKYQGQHQLEATGELETVTIRSLETNAQKLTEELGMVGFHVRTNSESTEVSDAINDYQRFLGLPPRGRIDSKTRTQLAIDLKTAATLKAAVKASNAATYLSAHPTGSVLAIEKDDGRTYALVSSGKTPELWAASDGQVRMRRKGDDALEGWDHLAANRARDFTTENSLILHFSSYKRGEPGFVTVGGGMIPFDPEGKSFKDFFNDPKIILAFKEHADKSSNKPKLLIYRDDSYRLNGSTATSAKSLFSEARRLRIDPQEIADAAHQVLGDRYQVGLASDLPTAVKNAFAVPKFKSGADFHVIVDSQSKGDYRTIDNVADALADAKIEIVEASQPSAEGAKIFIFAEHNSEGFRKRVLDQARNGRFTGGVVATAVCGLGGEAEFNSELIRISGAKAVIYYPMEVDSEAVQKVMFKFAELLQTKGAGDGDFLSLWNDSVDAAHSEAQSPQMQQMIQKLHKALMQYSKSISHQEGTNAD